MYQSKIWNSSGQLRCTKFFFGILRSGDEGKPEGELHRRYAVHGRRMAGDRRYSAVRAAIGEIVTRDGRRKAVQTKRDEAGRLWELPWARQRRITRLVLIAQEMKAWKLPKTAMASTRGRVVPRPSGGRGGHEPPAATLASAFAALAKRMKFKQPEPRQSRDCRGINAYSAAPPYGTSLCP